MSKPIGARVRGDGERAQPRRAAAVVILLACGALLVAPTPAPPARAAAPIKVFFDARAPNGGGDELWASDGTPAGTRMVRDINPGRERSEPINFQQLGSIMLFTPGHPEYGRELWRTDGTRDGTRMVKDLVPGRGDGVPKPGGPIGPSLGDHVYFRARFTRSGVTQGSELWRTDGTARGTQLVADILPGRPGSSPRNFVRYRNHIYFSARAEDGRSDLWRTDGTRDGTRRVKNFTPKGFMRLGTVFEGKLYFGGQSGANGDELWRTDGTARGTQMVAPRPGLSGRYPTDLTVAGDYLYFVNQNGLWRTDGTTDGTIRLRRTPAYPTIERVGQVLLFRSPNMQYDSDCDWELWRTRGTPDSTRAVRSDDFCADDGFADFTAIDGTLYFNAESPAGAGNTTATTAELWRSDGTADGTRTVQSIPLPEPSVPDYLTDAAGETFFFTMRGARSQLWRSDGTDEGTQPLLDANGQAVEVLGWTLIRFDP